MVPVIIVIALAAALMGSAATDGGKAIQARSDAAQAAIVKAVRR